MTTVRVLSREHFSCVFVNKSNTRSQSHLWIISKRIQNCLCSLLELSQMFRLEARQFQQNVISFTFLDFNFVRETSVLESNSSRLFNFLKEEHLLIIEQSDARAKLASSSCSSRPMDVGLNIIWWLDLYNKINIRNVKTATGNICCSKKLEPVFLE